MALAVKKGVYQTFDSQESKISITANKGELPPLHGYESQASYIAVWLCSGLMRHPEYTTAEDRTNVATILGDALSHRVSHYITTYDPASAEGVREWSSITDSHRLSLKKCESLLKLIANNPFIIPVRNDQCIGESGDTLLNQLVYVKLSDTRVTMLVGDHLALIRSRVSQADITLYTISQIGFKAIEQTCNRYGVVPFIPFTTYYPPRGSIFNCCCNIF